jgi:uncharacterized protein (DUF427 family)
MPASPKPRRYPGRWGTAPLSRALPTFMTATMQATWNGRVIAESDDTVMVEGNHYFPRAAVRTELLADSDTHTVCPWKGTASYHSVVVDGKTNSDAAWYYPDPKSAAETVRDRIAFWHGVTVQAKPES